MGVFEGREGSFDRIFISEKMKLCRASARARLAMGPHSFVPDLWDRLISYLGSGSVVRIAHGVSFWVKNEAYG